MWNVTKKAIAGVLVGAVALGTGGCATTMAAEKNPSLTAEKKSKNKQAKQTENSPSPKANTMYGMCRLLRAQGNSEQAEIALMGLKSEFPDFSPTYNDLAEIYIERGRLDEATASLDEGLKIAPADPVLQNNAGVCALVRHDYAKALEHFQNASGLAPYEARYKANVALATGLNGDPVQSKALYEKVVSFEAAERNTELIKQMLAPQEAALPTD